MTVIISDTKKHSHRRKKTQRSYTERHSVISTIEYTHRAYNLQDKEEYIPVGCVPTAAVAVTRCQHQWGSASGGDLPPEGPLRGGLPYPPSIDRRFWKHYLPLRSVIMLKGLKWTLQVSILYFWIRRINLVPCTFEELFSCRPRKHLHPSQPFHCERHG